MRLKLLVTFITAAGVSVCFARSAEPVGPAAWTVRNWIGILVDIALFFLALAGISALARNDKRRR